MNDPDFDPYLPPRAPVGVSTPKSSRVGHVEGNPWITMWTQPRGTIRTIVDTDVTRSVVLLAMFYGINSTLSRAMQKNTGDTVTLPALLGIALVGGSLGGILGNMIAAALVRWTGGWMGGRATYAECRAAIAWGSIPTVVNLALMLVLIGVFGIDLFRSVGLENVGAQKGMVLLVIGMAQMILAIWAAVLSLKAVGEVHGFSAWKALGAFLLVGLVFLGIILLIVAIVFVVSAAMKAGG